METTETETSEKVFNISTGQFEEKAAETKPEEGEKLKDEKPAEEKKPEEKPAGEEKPKDETKPVDHAAILKEKYGIEEAELTTLKETAPKLQTRIIELEQELKKPKEPEFASEQDKKAYDFIRTYPPSMMGEGLKTYSTLIDMDVPKVSEYDALKEKYVLSKPSLPREKAIKLFDSDFRKYSLKRDDFESDEEFKEAQGLKDIEREDDANSAREFLMKKQTEIKAKPAEKQPDKPVEEPKAPAESVKSYNAQIDAFLTGTAGKPFKGFSYKDTNDETISYNIELPAETIKTVAALMKSHLQRPDLYDKDGKIPNFDPQFLFRQFLMLSDPDAYDRMHTEKVIELARTLKAEQIAGKKPDKESKGGGDQGIPDYTTQFLNLANKAQEGKGGR